MPRGKPKSTLQCQENDTPISPYAHGYEWNWFPMLRKSQRWWNRACTYSSKSVKVFPPKGYVLWG